METSLIFSARIYEQLKNFYPNGLFILLLRILTKHIINLSDFLELKSDNVSKINNLYKFKYRSNYHEIHYENQNGFR